MRIAIFVAAACLLASVNATEAQPRRHAQQLQWINASNGQLPHGAVQGGYEANGQPLYVCRAHHLGGMHIGKFRADWRGCNIPYGGREITVNFYQVLVW